MHEDDTPTERIEIMEILQTIIGYGLIGIGVLLLLSASIGMLRFPDIFTRLHAAGVADSLGAPLVIIGLMVLEGFTLTSLKLLLLLVLLILTAPTACHALAKAAHLVLGKQKP
jgi:multicomponent Na+:H+ antiporter subunit G